MRFSDTDPFTILIDRLQDGQIQKLEESVAPAFLELHETELSFSQPVRFHGKAYTTGEHLIVIVEAETTCLVPCSTCNETFSYKIRLSPLTLAIDLDELRGHRYNFREELRTALLLEVPAFPKCAQHGGSCHPSH